MIKVKGFDYYNDSNMPVFEKEFNNLGHLSAYIQENALGKKKIYMPAHESDGSFNQAYSNCFSGNIRWIIKRRLDNGDVSRHIELITENGKILFSSGTYTDGRGHISNAVKQFIADLEYWISKNYDFAE